MVYSVLYLFVAVFASCDDLAKDTSDLAAEQFYNSVADIQSGTLGVSFPTSRINCLPIVGELIVTLASD